MSKKVEGVPLNSHFFLKKTKNFRQKIRLLKVVDFIRKNASFYNEVFYPIF